MYLLQLGVISSLLSETLVSGFTTGAAVHVLTSQIKDLFGLQLHKRKGLFKVILVSKQNCILNLHSLGAMLYGIKYQS